MVRAVSANGVLEQVRSAKGPDHPHRRLPRPREYVVDRSTEESGARSGASRSIEEVASRSNRGQVLARVCQDRGTTERHPGGQEPMTGYFLRRLLLIIPTFIGITTASFFIMQLVPGGPIERQIMAYKMAMAREG